jgi:hypothetical protein
MEKKPQISPLRCAPVEMTNLLHGNCQLFSECAPVYGSTNLSSRPERSGVERSAVSFPFLHTLSYTCAKPPSTKSSVPVT